MVATVVILRGWGPSLAVVYTSSMVPTYNPGDIVVIMKSMTPAVGDIAAFTAPLTPQGDMRIPVTHRLIGETPAGFITKGDATPQDWWRVSPDEIDGQVVSAFPRVWLYRVAALLFGIATLLLLWPRGATAPEGTTEWWRQRLRSGDSWLRSAQPAWLEAQAPTQNSDRGQR